MAEWLEQYYGRIDHDEELDFWRSQGSGRIHTNYYASELDLKPFEAYMDTTSLYPEFFFCDRICLHQTTDWAIIIECLKSNKTYDFYSIMTVLVESDAVAVQMLLELV
jgi:hypothetical protein